MYEELIQYLQLRENFLQALRVSQTDQSRETNFSVEHIFELQTVAQTLEFVVLQIIPSVNAGGVVVSEYQAANPGIPAWVNRAGFKNCTIIGVGMWEV
jgi:hypothetical protein